MRHNIIFILATFGFAIILFGAVLTGFAFNEIYLLRPAEGAVDEVVIIPGGANLKTIERSLAEKKLISSQLLFNFYVRLRGDDKRLRSGAFTIRVGSNIRAIVNLLTTSSVERNITIIEGWTARQIAGYLDSLGIDKNEFLQAAGRLSEDVVNYPFLDGKPTQAGLEGYFFPDTYRVFINARAEDVLRKMLVNFGEKTAAVYERASRQNKNFYEILIMASIVEREVRGDEDRKIVADIFWRRLNIGMPLQADSTVNYVTGKNTPAISLEDRDIESPYNTYRYQGLPPGPICNPSLSSIEAVLDPMPNQYLYFLTDSSGEVHYSRTLEEHNANKASYLR